MSEERQQEAVLRWDSAYVGLERLRPKRHAGAGRPGDQESCRGWTNYATEATKSTGRGCSLRRRQ
eukprot:9767592-Prorocentrum_lima.AAC.1